MSPSYVGTPWWAKTTAAAVAKATVTRNIITFTATTTTIINASPTKSDYPLPDFGDITFHDLWRDKKLLRNLVAIQDETHCIHWPFINYVYNLDKLILAHGVLAALALVVFFPFGAISMRLLKGRSALIFHNVLQGIATVLYLAALAIGLKVVNVLNYDWDINMSDRFSRYPCGENYWWSSYHVAFHTVLGVIVTVCLMLQPFLGLINHYFYKRKQRRTPWSHAHIWIGRAAITMGIINGGIGLWLAESDGRGQRIKRTRPISIIYTVFGSIIWAVWMLVAVRGEFVKAREERLTKATERAHSESSSGAGGEQWIKMQTPKSPERAQTSEEAIASN